MQAQRRRLSIDAGQGCAGPGRLRWSCPDHLAIRIDKGASLPFRQAHHGLQMRDAFALGGDLTLVVAELTRTETFCADRDRLFATGHAGGDFEADWPRDQPGHHRRAQALWPDRRGDARASGRRAFAYVTTRKFLEVFGFASLRDLPDLERLKAEGQTQRGQGRPTSTARSGSRTKATRLRARRKSSIRPRTSKNI
jgi:hypothetical protein